MSKQTIKLRKSVNTAPVSAATALEANEARVNYFIQNLGTNPLYVKEGSGATSSDFTFVLAGGTGADDGTGGSMGSSSGEVYTGVITIAGTSPRYTITEREENI